MLPFVEASRLARVTVMHQARIWPRMAQPAEREDTLLWTALRNSHRRVAARAWPEGRRAELEAAPWSTGESRRTASMEVLKRRKSRTHLSVSTSRTTAISHRHLTSTQFGFHSEVTCRGPRDALVWPSGSVWTAQSTASVAIWVTRDHSLNLRTPFLNWSLRLTIFFICVHLVQREIWLKSGSYPPAIPSCTSMLKVKWGVYDIMHMCAYKSYAIICMHCTLEGMFTHHRFNVYVCLCIFTFVFLFFPTGKMRSCGIQFP